MTNDMEARMWELAPLPSPSFPCGHQVCAEEASYPPDMLYWFDGNETELSGWYCEFCLSEMVAEGGQSLASELARREGRNLSKA